MMSISSPAGRRLARAKAEMDAADLATEESGDSSHHEQLYMMASFEFGLAAKAVADELIAHGFHDMDGED